LARALDAHVQYRVEARAEVAVEAGDCALVGISEQEPARAGQGERPHMRRVSSVYLAGRPTVFVRAHANRLQNSPRVTPDVSCLASGLYSMLGSCS